MCRGDSKVSKADAKRAARQAQIDEQMEIQRAVLERRKSDSWRKARTLSS